MSNSTETMPMPITTNGECQPCQTLPAVLAFSDAVLASPTQVPPTQVANAASAQERPTLEPPSNLAGQGGAAAAGWQTDKKVQGLWNNCVDRNGYMYVEGLGWRKFADNSDSAMIAFNIIAAHAKSIGKGANFYEGDDGKVNTLYVW